MPIARDIVLRPGHTTEEEQGQTGKDYQKDDVLAVAYDTADEHTKEDTCQDIRQEQSDDIANAEQGGEAEETWYGENEPCTCHNTYHEVAHGLSEHDTEESVVVLTDGYEVLITVVLTGSTRSQSDTQYQCLLDDQDEYGGNEEATIAARGIEYRHLFIGQRLHSNLIFPMCGVPTECYLSFRTEVGCHSLCRLVDGFVGHHQTHISVHADAGLLHAIQS